MPNDPAYVEAFFGAILDLSSAYKWANDDSHTAIIAARRMRVMYMSMAENNCNDCLPGNAVSGDIGIGDIMQWRQDGCKLQISVANDPVTGDPCWCTVYDGSLCVPNPAPGSGVVPPKSGACQDYNFGFLAQILTPLPFLVNTGDTLQINSVRGAGTDGSNIWYCPDGSVFFGGACVGGSALNPSDPLNTSAHMCVVLKIGSSYYPFFAAGTFTVPSGVVNQQAFVGVNDNPIGNDAGEYTIDLKYCNNSAPPSVPWCHFGDFSITADGFISRPFTFHGGCTDPYIGPYAVYSVGSGWHQATALAGDCVDYNTFCQCVIDLGAPTLLSSCSFVINVTSSAGAARATVMVSDDVSATVGVVNIGENDSMSNGDNTIGGYVGLTKRFITLWSDRAAVSGQPPAAYLIKSWQVAGTGLNPFGSSNC